jgi:uncharacterized membrane protein YhaH (DUF805 family)
MAEGAAVYLLTGMLLVQLVGFWLTVSLCARRLHDLGRSGWWQVAPYVAVIGCFALAEPAWASSLGLTETASELALLSGVVVYLVFLVALGVAPGRDAGPRPDPAAS